MPWPHPNLANIPIEVERPIPSTMRNLYEWDDFRWTFSPEMSDGISTEPASVRAHMDTEYGDVYVRWDLLDGKWKVATVVCPGWSDRRPRGPGTTKGVQRWLRWKNIPKRVDSPV